MKIQNIEELQVFAQIVESGSLRGAAKALKLPPTTVSRRLAMLEGRIGTKLVYRSTRSMSVSEAGRTLLRTAHIVLDELAAAEVALEREEQGLSGVVRISVLSILSEDLLTVLAPLLKKNPALRVEVQIADRNVNPVAAGVDVAIYGGALADSSLVAKKLLTIELVMGAADAYLKRAGVPKTLGDLATHEVLSFASAQPSWNLIDNEGGQHLVRLKGRLAASDARTLRDALVAGLGIGVTSSRVMRRHKHLRRVLPDYALATIPLFAVYPAAMQRSARLQAVVKYLQESLVAAS